MHNPTEQADYLELLARKQDTLAVLAMDDCRYDDAIYHERIASRYRQAGAGTLQADSVGIYGRPYPHYNALTYVKPVPVWLRATLIAVSVSIAALLTVWAVN